MAERVLGHGAKCCGVCDLCAEDLASLDEVAAELDVDLDDDLPEDVESE